MRDALLMANDVKMLRVSSQVGTRRRLRYYSKKKEKKFTSNAVLRPKIPMPLESKNPVTHDHDRQLMNVQTFKDLDARRLMPRSTRAPGCVRKGRG